MSHTLLWMPQAQDHLETVGVGVYRADFVLASRAAKLPYVWLQLEMVGALNRQTIAALDLAGPAQGELWDSWRAVPDLARDLARWVLMDGVAVVGGRDASNYESPGTPPVGGIDPSEFGPCLVRKDPLGFWSLLGEDGLVQRLSFEKAAPPQVRPFRSTWPERAELVVTDRCDAGCPFCSQDARPDGTHADIHAIARRIDELARARVMEVVIDGGEPTLHPQFARIVRETQARNMRAAFRTRRLDWFHGLGEKDADWRAVRWEYSVRRAHDVERVLDEPKAGVAHNRPGFSLVMGTEAAGAHDLADVARRCQRSWLQLSLHGFRRTGRGATFAVQEDAHWLDACAEARPEQVCIDAVLARKYELELAGRGRPGWLHEPDDGRYALQVDVARGLCGPLTGGPEERFAIPAGQDAMQQAFERINAQQAPSRLRRALEVEQAEAARAGDEQRLVLLDAAMEGRCERCGAAGARAAGGGLGRPRFLCPTCAERGRTG